MRGTMRRTPAILLTALAASGCLQRAAWLPDGKHVAYVRDGSVWVADLDGHQAKLATLPAGDDPELSAGPGGLVAVVARTAGSAPRLEVVDGGGVVRFSATLPGELGHMPAGCWSPNGRWLAVRTSRSTLYLADLQAKAGQALDDGGAVSRFTGAGDLIGLKEAKPGWKLEVRDATGRVLGGKAWKAPQGVDEALPVILNEEGTAAWWRGKRAGQEIAALAGADGKVVFSSPRALVAAGPDARSYVTEDGGYAVIRAAGEPVNLNPLYNRLLRMDLNWHLADPKSAAEAYDATALLKSCAPAFSPDGTKVALVTPRLLAVGTIATGEVTAVAKW